ncbi:unnamed protein product [Timema podura]|uniref:RNA helicase n=1 Tax=Timema podura TaxID=61482 RepID=A0ABN7NXD8_TIMPD|nr:unnamed protein product [Timema podura]
MDEGSVKEFKDYALMALPEELQALPPQAVEVYLCNVLPCDEDTVWNWSANEAMYNWVQENVAEEQEGVYMVGKSTIAGNYTHSRDRQGHLVASGRTRSPLHSPPFALRHIRAAIPISFPSTLALRPIWAANLPPAKGNPHHHHTDLLPSFMSHPLYSRTSSLLHSSPPHPRHPTLLPTPPSSSHPAPP